MITSDDVMLVLSWSGETVELRSLIDYSRRFRITLIAVTVSAESTLGKAADIVLALPPAREACPHNLTPTTSTLMQLALGDALAIALLESRGFTALDFGMLHPGGRLGALLKFARDVMHRGTAVPLVATGLNEATAIPARTGMAVLASVRGARRSFVSADTARRPMNKEGTKPAVATDRNHHQTAARRRLSTAGFGPRAATARHGGWVLAPGRWSRAAMSDIRFPGLIRSEAPLWAALAPPR